MPSLTTYFIIVTALAAAALALWLLTRAPAKPVKRKPAPRAVENAAPTPPPLPGADVEPELTRASEPADTPQPAVASEAEPTKPEPDATTGGPANALTTLKGLGPRAAARLNELGVTRFDQIAAWTDEDVARIDPQLGSFRGRIARDRWIEQAAYLAGGDKAGFEAKFGRLG